MLLFSLFAIVQINDPDPSLWVLVYSLSAIFCFLHHKQKLINYNLALLYGILSSLYGGIILLNQIGFYNKNQMMGLQETSREAIGLFIVAFWMFALYFYKKNDPSFQ